MNIQQAYNNWAHTYDTVENKTRDLEGLKLRETLSKVDFNTVLEIGCGTGKNTEWLLTRSKHVVAVDFSTEMLGKAKAKIKADNVEFVQADILKEWNFKPQAIDLITFSLVLEHIQNIDFVFKQARSFLRPGGFLYIGELHPFKQYQGSKARFETGEGIFELECFVHHVSGFFSAAQNNGLQCIESQEWFDHDDRTTTPRLLMMLFKAI
jgi:ubiquinone/menaquinone biosynthesis C-methylase UbiE